MSNSIGILLVVTVQWEVCMYVVITTLIQSNLTILKEVWPINVHPSSSLPSSPQSQAGGCWRVLKVSDTLVALATAVKPDLMTGSQRSLGSQMSLESQGTSSNVLAAIPWVHRYRDGPLITIRLLRGRRTGTFSSTFDPSFTEAFLKSITTYIH